jgi:putative ABC transport system permease protein
MYKNFFKVALRNIARHKVFSLINILGLAIGMACSILITIYIIDELSYDKYHNDHENIYRVQMKAKVQEVLMDGVALGAPAAGTFRAEIPEVESSIRVDFDRAYASGSTVKIGSETFTEEKMFFADSNIFNFFNIPLLQGNEKIALNDPNTMILTKSAAKKYFKLVDPVGKTLEINGTDFLVTGVAKDIPHNSHFHFNILASMPSYERSRSTFWLGNDTFYTYLKLRNDANVEVVVDKIQKIAEAHYNIDLQQHMGINIDQFFEAGNYFNLYLLPLSEIHLKSHSTHEIEQNSNIIYIYIFAIVAIFILIVASINFMNLSTARSATRAKESAMRKIVGAKRLDLMNQFYIESIAQSIIALIIAMIVVEFVLPGFSNITSKELAIGYATNLYVIPLLVGLAITVGIFSGAYSATFLSSVRIGSFLKGNMLTGKQNSWFRNVLVVFQFTVSIALIIGTLIIESQLKYIQNKDLGFEKENLIIVKKADMIVDKMDVFKNKMATIPEVEFVSSSGTMIGKSFSGFPCRVEDMPDEHVPRMLRADYEFDKTFKLEITRGRFYDEEIQGDTMSVLLNETAVKEFGLIDPIGKKIVTHWGGEEAFWKIIGVVKDFNFGSLHDRIVPLVILHPYVRNPRYVAIRINGKNTRDVIERVQIAWNELLPGVPFEYYFLNEDYKKLHENEFRTGRVFSMFSFLSILIACLGLFGLASFMAEKKTKEIGIRKSLGASVSSLVMLLTKQFTTWVVIANIIAWPLAWFFLSKWLQNFAYHTNINFLYFVVAGIIALLIAIITVMYQAYSASRINPSVSLKYE